MSDELEVVKVSAGAFVGYWRDVVITVWRSDIVLADVQASARAQELAGKRTGRFGAIALIESHALQVNEEVRKEAARVTEEAGERLVGVAVVLPVPGFRGAVARTVVTGIHMLSRSPSPQKVFAQIPPATEWVMESLGRPVALAHRLAQAVDLARQRRDA